MDKDLFLHDLAIVSILKNEGAYLKEWLDYHLMAGVEHFYLYDNDSTDNQAEVVKPYVEAGLVDYFFLPGKAMQYAAYNDALKRFKFHCRYMVFLDGDEFIYPKVGNVGILDVVDEILSKDSNAAGLAIHWQCFGSNGEVKADYSRGVLERFTRRPPVDFFIPANTAGNAFVQGNCYVKNIVNPRKIVFFKDPHTMIYFKNFHGVDEGLAVVKNSIPSPTRADKIAINHYYLKSKEEFTEKIKRGSATRVHFQKKLEWFDVCDRNEEFDDGILKYRDEREKVYQPPNSSKINERVMPAILRNLFPTVLSPTQDFYKGKLETFLTCRAISSYLKTKLEVDAPAKFFEEAALKSISKSLDGMSDADIQLLIRELPNLLSLPYSAVEDFRKEFIQRIPQIMDDMHVKGMWVEYVELDYIKDLLNLKG